MATLKNTNGALKALGKKPAVYLAENRSAIVRKYALGVSPDLLAIGRNAQAAIKKKTREVKLKVRRRIR